MSITASTQHGWGKPRLRLPFRRRGRPGLLAPFYKNELRAWTSAILKINSTLDFQVSSRGWCYILEEYGLEKGQFDRAQDLINDCRKDGTLPLDICAEDEARSADGLEHIDASPEHEADSWIDALQGAASRYTPFSFWDDKDVYLQVLVEKIDLKSLFSGICAEYRIPIVNARGWSDINSRAALMRRFADHEAKGRRPVLLYCGDHDPAGVQIADTLLANFQQLRKAVGWDASSLEIDHFGLTREFIDANGLSWIDGLHTGSGSNLADPRHKDHFKPYVQEYLKAHQARKVEANALVTRPDAGRQLLRDTISKYVPLASPAHYDEALRPHREVFDEALRERLAEEFAE